MIRLQQTGGAPRYLLDGLVTDAIDRASFLRFNFHHALVIGDWCGEAGSMLREIGAAGCLCDIAEPDFDEERPFGCDRFDFILSLNSLDTVNDLPGALIHLRNALVPGGLMIASFPGAGSLPVLRKALMEGDGDRPAARIHPQIDVRSGAQLLQRAGFSDPVADCWRLEVRFSSLDRLIADLRAQGLGNVLSRPGPPLGKSALQRARRAFAAAGTNGRTTECFEILTLTGWKG